jgi:hypothetical protein
VTTPASALAGTLTVALEGVLCTDQSSIARAVERDTAGLMSASPDLVLVVRPVGPDSLSLKLVGAGSSRARTVPFASRDCAALPDALSLIVKSWVSHRLLESSVFGVDVEARSEDHSNEQRALAKAPVPPMPAQSHELVSLAFLGGGSYDAHQPAPGLEISTVASVAASSSWGAGLKGSYRAAIVSSESWGSFRTDSGLLAALGMARLRPAGSLRLDLFAGPALDVLHARATLRATTRSKTSTTLAGLGSAQLRGAISERLGWVAAVDVVVRLQSQELSVDQEVVRRIGQVGASAQIGISWDAL